MRSREGFVAVHIGAGFHNPAKRHLYDSALRRACLAAAEALRCGESAICAVEEAIKVLEDDPVVNAGLGSNLTRDGTVECDASIVDGAGACGAVGAVPGLAHPIQVAALLAQESRDPLPLGLVRPVMLAGDGARRWAASRNLPTASPSSLAGYHVTPQAHKAWLRYEEMLDQEEKRRQQTNEDSLSCLESSPPEGIECFDGDLPIQPGAKVRGPGSPAGGKKRRRPSDSALDTVGCICVDPKGGVAAGVSSGGLVLKSPGRVGQAGVVGAGCWAEGALQVQEGLQGSPGALGDPFWQPPAVAVSVSGVGERIMVTGLARHVAGLMVSEVQPHPTPQETPPGPVPCTTYEAGNVGVACEISSRSMSGHPPAEGGAHSDQQESSAADGHGSGESGAFAETSEGEEGLGSGASTPNAEGGAEGALECCLNDIILRGPPPHDCGVIALVAQCEGRPQGDTQVVVRFMAAHCSKSFGVAFMATSQASPSIDMMRRCPGQEAVVSQGHKVVLS